MKFEPQGGERQQPEQQFVFGEPVSVPDEVATPLVDLMRTPKDGTDRNSHIVWQGASLAVQASIVDGLKYSSVVVNYRDPERGDEPTTMQGFGFENGAIATVSGWHTDARAELSEELNSVLGSLAEESIEKANQTSG